MSKGEGRGWHRESKRHADARKGIKTSPNWKYVGRLTIRLRRPGVSPQMPGVQNLELGHWVDEEGNVYKNYDKQGRWVMTMSKREASPYIESLAQDLESAGFGYWFPGGPSRIGDIEQTLVLTEDRARRKWKQETRDDVQWVKNLLYSSVGGPAYLVNKYAATEWKKLPETAKVVILTELAYGDER